MEFNFGDINWVIKEISQKEIKEKYNKRQSEKEEPEDVNSVSTRYYGATFYDECVIYIDRDISEDRKRKTLLHELTHVYINEKITHKTKQYDEESVCDIVANSHSFVSTVVEHYFKHFKIESGIKNMEEKYECKCGKHAE